MNNDLNNPVMWSPGVTIDEIEKQVILKAFRFYRCNKTATASALGIAIRTLDNKLERYESDDREREKRDAERRARNEDFLNHQRGLPQRAINDSAEEREAQRKALLPGSDARARMEPAQIASEKQPVSMQERKEIQGMLPERTSSSHPRRARQGL